MAGAIDDIETTLREEDAFELEQGREAFEYHRARLELLPESALRDQRLPRLSSLPAILRLARYVQFPPERNRFVQMPGFDLRNVDELDSMAAAYWYTSVQMRGASAGDVTTLIDGRMVARAAERRARLWRLLDYHLGDYPLVHAELSPLRSFDTYEQLAADLVRLAELHEVYRAEVIGDSRNYRLSDAEQARAQAAQILGQLTERRGAVQRWVSFSRCAAALLQHAYREVSCAAAWIYRDDPAAATMFPSLHGSNQASMEPPRSSPPAMLHSSSFSSAVAFEE